jgi:hypothetical protein
VKRGISRRKRFEDFFNGGEYMRRTSGNELVGNNHVVNHFSKGGFMKRFESGKAYLVCMVIMSVFVSILSGCGGSGGGHWTAPVTPGAVGVMPTVVATVPATTSPGPTLNIPTNEVITVAFSKEMAPATLIAPGAFVVTGPGSTTVAAAVPAVTYDVASKTATFHPLAPLSGGVTYTATIKGVGANPATDVAGHALAGNSTLPLVANDYVWSFTTSLALDTTLPQVTITVPATTTPGPTLNVPTNSLITAVFNEDMAPATLTASGAFTVTGPGSTAVAAAAMAVTYDVVSKTATFHPLAALAGGVTYTATIKGIGTNPATDAAGNALAGNPATPLVANDYVWTFTTSLAPDTTKPLVTVTVPATTTPGPTLNVLTSSAITATFNENMLPSTLTAPNAFTVTGPGVTPVIAAVPAVTYDILTRTATFHPLAALASGTTYTATIKGIGAAAATDSAGNALAGVSTSPTVANDYVWSFTTSAVIPHLGPLAVNLLGTQPYGVLSSIGITLGGGPLSTTGFRVDGDVGIFPAGACVGCDNTTVTKLIENGTVPAQTAMTDLVAVYNDAIGRTLNLCTLVGSGSLTVNPPLACGGTADGTFAPGLYWSSTSIAIPAGGTITLDGKNDPTAVFIFQSESTINTIGGNTHVILTNQAQAKNVFWVAKSSATIGGTTSDFKGTAIALIAVTVNTGTDMLGRALARGAAVTVQDGAKITVPLP